MAISLFHSPTEMCIIIKNKREQNSNKEEGLMRDVQRRERSEHSEMVRGFDEEVKGKEETAQ